MKEKLIRSNSVLVGIHFFPSNIFWGDFMFLSYYIQHGFICRPSDSSVPTDAGIEPRTVTTGALAVRRIGTNWFHCYLAAQAYTL
jgi:hypothetical protein